MSGELKGVGVSGSGGDNSPFRSARPKKLHIRDPRTRNSTPHISWYPRVILDELTEPNGIPAGTATPARAEYCVCTFEPRGDASEVEKH